MICFGELFLSERVIVPPHFLATLQSGKNTAMLCMYVW